MKQRIFSRAGSEARSGAERRVSRPAPARDALAYAAALEILG